MIPDEVVEQVRESADIVQIIGEYVQLKRTGADYRGPCPFHQGTHRNFSVSPRKKMYYCFVCGEHGDVFRFLQKRLGVEWPAAVKIVGEKSGIEVREVERRREGPDPREPYWEVNAAAAEYFQRMLWDDPLGAPAREYLEKRGIGRDVAERVELGFAPREIGLLRTHLASLGYDDDRLLDAGILVRPEDGAEPRPRFRGRLMFPIQDTAGRHAGFGGRLIGPGEPKYLNSADSPVFSKGRLLYGLHWARNEIRREDRALVVEGYFDVIGLIAAGIHSAIAPLGTALTPDQAVLLRRYTRTVYLLYDSDRAGLVASFRSGDELLRHGVTVRVVTLPEGEDPDTFVRAQGAKGVEEQIAQAVDVFERKIQLLQRAGAFSELHRKRRALDRLLPTIRAASDPLTRDLYVARTSEVTGIDRSVLQRELGAAAAGDAPEFRARQLDAGSVDRRPQPADEHAPADTAEREIIRALLINPAVLELVTETVGPDVFMNRRYRRIYAAILALGDDWQLPALLESLDDTSALVVQGLLVDTSAIVDSEATVRDSLNIIRARWLEAEMDRIQRELTVANDSEQTELLKLKQERQQELTQLGGAHFKAFRRKHTAGG